MYYDIACFLLTTQFWIGITHTSRLYGHHPTIDHRNRAAAGHLGSALHLPVFPHAQRNAERETQYQQMINHLSTNVVEGIADINDKLDDMVRRLDS